MRILYVGELSPISTSLHRALAFERLGHEIISLDPGSIMGGRYAFAFQIRTLAGPGVVRLNHAVMKIARRDKPHMAWFDKPTFIWPRTIRALREAGIVTVHKQIDNPFGPRHDPGWRLTMRSIREFDLNLVPRIVNLEDYRKAGARDVMLLRNSYEPTMQFPPPDGWSDADRDTDVSFIGSPYDNRGKFLLSLVRDHGIPVRLRGERKAWSRVLTPEEASILNFSDAVYGDAYREAIWRSCISLAFVTHSNLDDYSQRSFEIAGCQGFMLGEPVIGFTDAFEPDREAVFFSNISECAEAIRKYLPDEAARSRIALAARRRAESSGYSNDARLAKVLDYLYARFPQLPKN